jgi:hypothetical protein
MRVAVMAYIRRSRFPPGPVFRDFAELRITAAQPEDVLPIDGARVAVAEYDVLHHDFPALRTGNLVRRHPELASLPAEARRRAVRRLIDQWVVANAAVVSTAQARQSIANSPIAVTTSARKAYRPPHYGRAVIVQTDADGLLDVKGVGVAPGCLPRCDSYANGLEYLGVAIADLMLKRLCDEIFRAAASAFWTVPVYAVLDLGFDVVDGMFGTAPAGMHVRRAHRRPAAGMSVPHAGSIEERVKVEMEMLLRNYGITTTNSWNSIEAGYGESGFSVRVNRKPADGLNVFELELLRHLLGTREYCCLQRINVQLADAVQTSPLSGQLVDFGHINVKSSFDHPVWSAVQDRPLCLGGVLWPDSEVFIQPDPRLALDVRTWGRDAINEFGFDLGMRFRRGELPADEVGQRMHQRLSEVPWVSPPVPLAGAPGRTGGGG